MYTKFEECVTKGAIGGFKWICKVCRSPAHEYTTLDTKRDIWEIDSIRCRNCGNVWRREQ